MKVTTKMIKRKAKVPLNGLMVDVIKEVGKMANNTEKESMLQPMVKKKKANGKKESESNGSQFQKAQLNNLT